MNQPQAWTPATVTADDATRATDEPKRSSVVTFLGLAAIVAAFLLIVALRSGERDVDGDDPAIAHPAVGAPFDDFEVRALTADVPPVTAADVKGKVVLVNFWGPWCGWCRVEFPHLAKLQEKLKDRSDFVWLPVTYDGQSNSSPSGNLRQEASAFLAQSGLSTPTYYDPDRSLLIRANAIGAFEGSFPLTMLIDQRGHVHAVWRGFSPGGERRIEKAVVDLLD